jgi:MoaA/NifB/PqqE/SkfB family radical SAM enzyme
MSCAVSNIDQGGIQIESELFSRSRKLWLYTNFDCNLWCKYCVAESSPKTSRRELGIETVRQVVDEADQLGFEKLFFTGGEPFILADIYDMLAYSSNRLNTTVLTNAMLFNENRFNRLCEINHDNLSVQVSLDGAQAEIHDAYRGEGTWEKTIDGIRLLLSNGFHVCISTTATPANADHMDEIRTFVGDLGIDEGDHFIRPLAKRGFSDEGIEVGVENLQPEVTISADGVYWHPLVSPSDGDMLISEEIFPLAKVVECIEKRLARQNAETGDERTEVQ